MNSIKINKNIEKYWLNNENAFIKESNNFINL
jgi:hypothetical protein